MVLCSTSTLLAAVVGTALAHAELIRSSPAAGERLAGSPTQITLWFNEELDTLKSEFQLYGADGRPVESVQGRVDLNDPDHASMVGLISNLAEGGYTIHWRAVTIDDDGLTEGDIRFAVGDAPLPPPLQLKQALSTDWLIFGSLIVVALAALVGMVVRWRKG
jgi:copper transport protein